MELDKISGAFECQFSMREDRECFVQEGLKIGVFGREVPDQETPGTSFISQGGRLHGSAVEAVGSPLLKVVEIGGLVVNEIGALYVRDEVFIVNGIRAVHVSPGRCGREGDPVIAHDGPVFPLIIGPILQPGEVGGGDFVGTCLFRDHFPFLSLHGKGEAIAGDAVPGREIMYFHIPFREQEASFIGQQGMELHIEPQNGGGRT